MDILFFVIVQDLLFNLFILGTTPSLEEYLNIELIFSTGTYTLSFPAYNIVRYNRDEKDYIKTGIEIKEEREKNTGKMRFNLEIIYKYFHSTLGKLLLYKYSRNKTLLFTKYTFNDFVSVI